MGFLRQWHPRMRSAKPMCKDRFRPLSKHPNKLKPRDDAKGPVMGEPTEAEKDLLDGKLGGQHDPFKLNKALSDIEEPAAAVEQDEKDDKFNTLPAGEPLSDALLNSWDMQNGVADPQVCVVTHI